MTRNAQIDGWRGISVVLVIIGHLTSFRYAHALDIRPFSEVLHHKPLDLGLLAWNMALRLLQALPETGVQMFFVISGFLISSLLLREERKNGFVSIAAFYVRRAGRIMPALFVLMLTLFALRQAQMITLPTDAFVRAGLYLCNVDTDRCGWWLTHTWSLSVEEQFYLIWPLLFVLAGATRRIRWLAGGAVLLVAASFRFDMAIHFGCIAAGALYALSPRFRAVIDRLSTPTVVVVAAVILLVQPFAAASSHYRVLEVARPLDLSIIFFGTLRGFGPFAAIVSWKWLQRIGLASYSLYLWQQLSTAPVLHYVTAPEILKWPILFVVPAMVSYYWIEGPMIRVAHRISQRLTDRGLARRATPAADDAAPARPTGV